MAARNPTAPLNVRLPLYAYTAPLWRERRVRESGCGEGAAAAFLARHGAADVVSLDIDGARLERARARYAGPGVQFVLLEDLQQLAAMSRRFDVVFVPDGEAILSDPDAVGRVRNLLREGGFVVVAVPAGERQSKVFRGGVGYYDLADTLAREFRVVRMLGQTPFLGFGLVEFDAPPARATRPERAARRLYEAERRARARADEAETRSSELRRKLEEALIQSESSVRVARAQSDEIEELRARLRRSAEDRALSDTELAKLRRALTEADDS